jgi:hypothetical protein
MNNAPGHRAMLPRVLVFLLATAALLSACGDSTSPFGPKVCSSSQGVSCVWDINRALFPANAGTFDQGVDHSIDVLFLPDQEYGDLTQAANFTQFWNDAVNLVINGFYHNNLIASNITLFHFWLSSATGATVTIPANKGGACAWNVQSIPYTPTWADSELILHKGDCRDFTQGKFSSVQAGLFGVAVHEFAHSSQAFRLPDEYSAPTFDGGYFSDPPEMYVSAMGDLCNTDPANSAWRPAQGCASWTPKSTVANCAGCLVWDSEDASHTLMATYSPTVALQFGPANWAIIQNTLAKVAPSGVPLVPPSVFSPSDWTPPAGP